MTIIGIDLGTTNSAVAVMKNGKPVILENARGGRTTPSVVQIDLQGVVNVGESAISGLVSMSDRTVIEVKRLMGSDQKVKLGDTEYRPEEVSAMILKALKQDAEDKLGEPVTEAVITVPAYFTDAQRKATQLAGELAGLKVERILNEPTAAAISYGLENMDKDQHVLVYDLGGGTFDVSVVEMFDGILEVKASAGNNHLGGADFDNAIVDWVLLKIKQMEGIDLLTEGTKTEILVRRNRLKIEAEKVKKMLSGAPSAKFEIPFFAFFNGAPYSVDLEITRAQFEKLIKELAVSTLKEVDKALEDSGIKIKDIHEVLLVGGSTRIPLIQELVTQKFGKAPRKDINPDEAVALGAAVQAGIKSGVIDSKDGLMITDVSPYTLGISISRMVGGQLMHGFFDQIIERNTTIPVTQSKVYCTIDDNQDAVTIRVFQGEDSYAENNNYLGEVTLPDLPMAPAGLEVKVTFQYNINGYLDVEAMILTTGKKVVTTIRGQAGVMNEQEMAAAKKKMTKTFEQSELYQSVKVVVNRAEQVLDELSGSEKEKIEALLGKLKQAAANNDSLMVSKYEEELTDLLIELV